MKFWKCLSNLIEETLPDWRDKFLSYKDLKQQLKMIFPKEEEECSSRPNKRQRVTGGGGEETEEDAAVTKEVIDFVKLLEEEIHKFNVFFLDQQEEYIIRFEVLQDRVEESKDSILEMMKVGREIVDFHGEMVLLENYSALNYTGLVKILKKYDKLSGALIRLPFIQKVLQEPFFKTDVLNELVEKCVSMLDQYFPMSKQSVPSVPTNEEGPRGTNTSTEPKEPLLKVPQELAEIENMENKYVRHTLSALRVLKQIRSGSSTVSAFSLPPLQNEVGGDVWKKTTVFEQAARSS